ncbi:MAG: hypothetical protein ACRBC3_19740 [Burkholderiaceae bacterium]
MREDNARNGASAYSNLNRGGVIGGAFGSEVKEESQISASLRDVSHVIQELAETIDELEGRLTGVMADSLPGSKAASGETPEHFRSPINQSLQDKAQAISQLRSQVSSILARLEL